MYLGIDLGTSAVKILLVDEQQKTIATSSAALNVQRPFPGWSEQDPASWIKATEKAIGEIKVNCREQFSQIRGIGLSGQMHGATLLGKDAKVLRPSILWNDTRSHREAAHLDANSKFRKITGNVVFPGFTAPKLQCVKHNEPEIFEKTARVLLPKDYLRLWLTGEFLSDPSDASGTSWFDVGRREWSNDLLSICELKQSQMPAVVEGSAVGGTLRSRLASKWGLAKDVVIAGGAGDNAASAIGMGVVDAGSAFLSLGTSGVIFAANDRYLPNPENAVHAFCHALPLKWHQMGVILSATDALNWYSGITGQSPNQLTGELGIELQAPGSATFLPYLSGERTPHNDSEIRGSFVGLGHHNDRADLTRAVLEGVGFAFRDCLNTLQNAGTGIDRVTVVGGGANSEYWLKAISTILSLPVDLPGEGDFGAGFGAARLAIMAVENAGVPEVCTPPRIKNTIEPDRSLIQAYDDAYLQYSALYPALKGVRT